MPPGRVLDAESPVGRIDRTLAGMIGAQTLDATVESNQTRSRPIAGKRTWSRSENLRTVPRFLFRSFCRQRLSERDQHRILRQ